MDPLVHKPLGQLLLALAVVMVATGSWVIGRLVEIEI
jgi:Flp pilus assembly protein TadB